MKEVVLLDIDASIAVKGAMKKNIS